MTPKVAAFEPDAKIIPGGVRAARISGHTPVYPAYRITSGKHSLLYIGGATHHCVVPVQRPGGRILFDSDPAATEASRQRRDAQRSASGERLYVVPFPFPSIGKIVKVGDGCQCSRKSVTDTPALNITGRAFAPVPRHRQ